MLHAELIRWLCIFVCEKKTVQEADRKELIKAVGVEGRGGLHVPAC